VSELPAGTVTLVFSDVEGSTRLLQLIGTERFKDVLSEHHRLLRDAVASSGGYEVDVQGDGFLFAFSRPTDAVAAAVAAQRALGTHGWPDDVELRVRMGIHTGEPTISAMGYVGLDVHRAARISAAAHGGQVLVSETTHGLVAGAADVSFRDLGEHRLKDLLRAQRLFQVVAEGLEAAFPPPRSLNTRATNLPVQATPLIGRERELSELNAMIDRSRLLTLTGPGGIGKTRLAMQAAADSSDGFEGGIYFVPLEAVADPTLVLATVASTVGVREGPGKPLSDSLAERFSEEPVLLVLDNFEHVLEAARDFSALLGRCEPLKALTTSREPLRVAVEQEYPVSPLDDDDALALFRERARAVKPDFAPTADDEEAVREVCARVDRLPLAVELAAARVKLLAPRELATRLDQRLAVLTGGARDRPSRQQTLRAAIEWSYDLLGEAERDLFERLAVFAGGWSLAAAETICDANLDLMGSLVDKSLVVQVEDVAGETRFAMLETIREFALERLRERGDYGELRRRHAEYFADTMPDPMVVRFQEGGLPTTVFVRLQAETDNLRTALAWAVETESEHELRLATLYQLSPHVGPTEGRRVLRDSLERSTLGRVARARALLAAGGLTRLQGDFRDAQALLEEALALYRAADEPEGVIEALCRLGFAAVDAGDLDRAEAFVSEAESVANEAGDLWLMATTMAYQATFPLIRGDFDEARGHMERLLALCEQIGDAEGVAFARGELALVMLLLGETWDALRGLEETLRFWREVQYPGGTTRTLGDLAAAFAAIGATGPAVRIYSAAQVFRAGRGVKRVGAFLELEHRVMGPVRDAADDPRYRDERAAGEAMSPDEATDYALGVVNGLRGEHEQPTSRDA
jgi:predicted ATPase/class 3 adenylate cyclase